MPQHDIAGRFLQKAKDFAEEGADVISTSAAAGRALPPSRGRRWPPLHRGWFFPSDVDFFRDSRSWRRGRSAGADLFFILREGDVVSGRRRWRRFLLIPAHARDLDLMPRRGEGTMDKAGNTAIPRPSSIPFPWVSPIASSVCGAAPAVPTARLLRASATSRS